jgi:hypothetical protein
VVIAGDFPAPEAVCGVLTDTVVLLLFLLVVLLILQLQREPGPSKKHGSPRC